MDLSNEELANMAYGLLLGGCKVCKKRTTISKMIYEKMREPPHFSYILADHCALIGAEVPKINCCGNFRRVGDHD